MNSLQELERDIVKSSSGREQITAFFDRMYAREVEQFFSFVVAQINNDWEKEFSLNSHVIIERGFEDRPSYACDLMMSKRSVFGRQKIRSVARIEVSHHDYFLASTLNPPDQALGNRNVVLANSQECGEEMRRRFMMSLTRAKVRGDLRFMSIAP